MADMAGAEKAAVLDGKGGQGESLPLDTLDNVIAFFWRSMDVLQLLNVVKAMPRAPFPDDSYPNADDGSKKNWQRLHPQIPAKSIYREHNTTPRAMLGRWFDAKDSAYKQANSDEMRADIVNLGSVLGERQNILVDFPNMAESERDASTLKTLAEITSEITGFTLAEFERCLSALRRQIHVAAVQKNPESPKTISGNVLVQISDNALKILRIVATSKTLLVHEALAGRNGLPKDVKTIGHCVAELLKYEFVERESSKSGIRITAAGRDFLK